MLTDIKARASARQHSHFAITADHTPLPDSSRHDQIGRASGLTASRVRVKRRVQLIAPTGAAKHVGWFLPLPMHRLSRLHIDSV